MSARSHGSRRAPFAMLLFALLGGGLVLLLGLNTASAANELRRHDLAARDEAVAASIVALRNAVAASAAPENLAAHAAQYGMVPAGDPAFLLVGKTGAVRVLGRPAPATSVPLPAPVGTGKSKQASGHDAGHGKKAKTTKKATSDKSPSPSPTSTSTSAANPAERHSTSPSPSPSPSSAPPSPTPVPVITLPGGTR
jgi:hypothetical protein